MVKIEYLSNMSVKKKFFIKNYISFLYICWQNSLFLELYFLMYVRSYYYYYFFKNVLKTYS